jgi:hypothetical protein
MEMFSTEFKDIAAALSKAQGEFTQIPKGKIGAWGAYSTLDDYEKAIRPAMVKHGLSYSQIIVKTETGHDLITMILHSSGQFLRSALKLNPEKQTMQGFGACITYMRRYALAAILGLTGTEDAEDSKDEVPYVSNNKKSLPSTNDIITLEQANELYILVDQSSNPKKCLGNILYANKIEELEHLPENKYETIKDYILHKFKA